MKLLTICIQGSTGVELGIEEETEGEEFSEGVVDGSFELGRLRIAALYEGGRAGGWIGGLVVDDALEEREGW